MAVIGKTKRRELAKKKRAATLRAKGVHKPKVQRGRAHGNAQLTATEVRTMRALHSLDGWSVTELAEHYGVGPGHVQQILARTIWKQV
jgi:DNA-binding MarR family transcriptional regulator